MVYNEYTNEREKMSESVIEIVEVSNTLPLKHQIGKLLLATFAAFAATKLAEKSYDAGLQAWNNRSAQIPSVEG